MADHGRSDFYVVFTMSLCAFGLKQLLISLLFQIRTALILGVRALRSYLKLICEYYALIDRARGPYEEIFVLTFKAYGPNAVRSMRLECQNKYFPYGPKSRLIRALLYTNPSKTV